MSDTNAYPSPSPSPSPSQSPTAGRSASPGGVSLDLSVSSSNLTFSSNDFNVVAAGLGTSSTEASIHSPSLASLASVDAFTGNIRDHVPPSVGISPYGWYRVLVFSQKSNSSMSEMLEQLRMAVMPHKLRYYYLKEVNAGEDQASFSFYVDSYSLATKLSHHGQLAMSVGVMVTVGWPLIKVNEAYKSKLRSLMMARYDSNRRCLDMCFIYGDYHKLGDFCVLEQPDCLEAVLEVAQQELPLLRSLLLDSNQLTHLDGFWGVERRLPYLQLISLRNNNLKTLDTLCALQHLPLTDLGLAQNPLPYNYERQLTNIFPKLVRLDGRMLRRSSSVPSNCAQARTEHYSHIRHVPNADEVKPPPSPSPPLTLPSRIISLPVSSSVQLNVRSFVLRYLQALDGENRTEHLEAFYKQAVMVTLTLARDQGEPFTWAEPYIAFSRQQLASRRAALEMYASWPRTFHLESTLNFDVIIVQPGMVCITFTGNFVENEKDGPLKYYMRCFVLLRNSGQAEDSDEFVIANELIYLSPNGRNVPPQSVAESLGQLNPEEHTLIDKLSAHTHLNSHWSGRFLQQANWDYLQAVQAYDLCLSRRQIPDNAFTDGTQPEPEP